jgi:hypothetical protein
MRVWGAGAIAACVATSALAGGGGSPSAQAEAALLAQLTGSATPQAPLRVGSPSLPTFARLAPARPSVPAAERHAFVPLAEEAAAQHGIDVEFFKRLIRQESGYNPNAVSSAGAQGIAQFMPGTAAMVGLDDPFDPKKALPKSAEHLASLRQRLGNLGLAAAAYNAGEGRVRAWLSGRSGLPAETQNYVLAITGKQAAEWAPAGTSLRTVSLPALGARGAAGLPSVARMQSAEWQLGATLLGQGQSKLATLLNDAGARPPRKVAERTRRSGEGALCASLGCIVAAAY